MPDRRERTPRARASPIRLVSAGDAAPEGAPEAAPDGAPGAGADAGRPADLAQRALHQARELAAVRARDTAARTRADSRRAARSATAAAAGTRDPAEPVSLGDSVRRLLDARGWRPAVAAAEVLTRWAGIVGPDIAAHSRAVSLTAGTLTVEAESTAWATQLRLLSVPLLERIAAEVGAGVVTTLVVRGPAAPSWRHGGWSVPGRGPRDTYG